MSETVIKIENISKQYRLGLVGTGTIKNDFIRWLKVNLLRQEDPFLKIGEKNVRETKDESGYVWALKNVNFEVKQGEVLGIIGKNGAGKSTLLKILSNVTAPTTGTIRAKGRIGSLLEVGTGFHPELTGRDNIYLNGSILGMKKQEINKKLDEIIDFAGVARYIDTPVKRYSSGMIVRLGFAVAAYLEPEILVVDEVLAVGDAEFQKKAIGKMQDVSRNDGRTVLFVSHNMAAVKSLCVKGMVLNDGSIGFTGFVDDAVAFYLKGENITKNKRLFNENSPDERFYLKQISLNPNNGSSSDILDEYHEIELNTYVHFSKEVDRLHITYVLKNDSGEPLFTFSHKSSGVSLKIGLNHLVCIFPKGFLNFGAYFLDIYIIEDSLKTVCHINDVLNFEVQVGKREIGSWTGKEPGFIKPQFKWKNN